MKKLDLSQLDNQVERDNFRKLDDEFGGGNPLLTGEWRIFDLTFTASGTYSVVHKLGFLPLDLIVTHDTAGFAWDHADFTNTTISIDTAGAGRVRFLLGRMK